MPPRGYVQVYTGNGKGKTTAALGLALRAAGWGYRSYMAQFMKKGAYGELKSVCRNLADWITIEQFGLPGFYRRQNGLRPGEKEAALKGMRRAAEAMRGGDYRIVILDEVNTLLHFHILEESQVLDLIDTKPASIELVLTGRYAPESILARADLITEMLDVRHYFASGVAARKGIEK